MRDPRVVRRRQAARDLPRVVDGRGHRERTLSKARPERRTVEQFRGDVRDALFAPDIEHPCDVRVAQDGAQARIALETRQLRAVGGEAGGGQHLQGDEAIRPPFEGPVHLAVRPTSERAVNSVMAKGRARRQRHGRIREIL